MTLILQLTNESATLALGRILATSLPTAPPYPALLLKGSFGAGKTTLVRGLVATLPGGDVAKVASPSFIFCHLYPTRPEVAHFDFYRLEGQKPYEEFFEILENHAIFAIMEWADFLPDSNLPTDRLILRLDTVRSNRTGTLIAIGPTATRQLQTVMNRLVTTYGTNTMHKSKES
ncbi:tRNA threonylcarbamoyladenosine biosynthesis protein TsaE [Desulfovibrionales bacterium]